jgi:hypothetical protein
MMGTGNWQLGKYTFFISYHDVNVKRQAVKLDVALIFSLLLVGFNHDRKIAVGA